MIIYLKFCKLVEREAEDEFKQKKEIGVLFLKKDFVLMFGCKVIEFRDCVFFFLVWRNLTEIHLHYLQMTYSNWWKRSLKRPKWLAKWEGYSSLDILTAYISHEKGLEKVGLDSTNNHLKQLLYRRLCVALNIKKKTYHSWDR